MKVQILTFQFAKNYGAILQAHALSSYIREELKEDCEIIQYWPKGSDASWKIYSSSKHPKMLIYNIHLFLSFRVRREKNKRNLIMANAIDELLPLGDKRYNRSTILSDPPRADAYICGSDQVWNFVNCFDDPTYFFDFTKAMKNVRRIGYAPSIADPWPKERWDDFRDYLSNMDYISVREKSDVDVVEKLSGKHVSHVIDPVFLKSEDYWSKLAVPPEIKEPYIFCYFLGTNDLAVELVKKVREVTGCKIVHLNLNARDRFGSDYDLRAVSPQQFLGFIKNATYVCTNSFHCSAFSVIFRRNYCVAPKGFANARMESLQEMFGLGQRLFNEEVVSKMENSALEVNYTHADDFFKPYEKISKEFLNNALYGNKD